MAVRISQSFLFGQSHPDDDPLATAMLAPNSSRTLDPELQSSSGAHRGSNAGRVQSTPCADMAGFLSQAKTRLCPRTGGHSAPAARRRAPSSSISNFLSEAGRSTAGAVTGAVAALQV